MPNMCKKPFYLESPTHSEKKETFPKRKVGAGLQKGGMRLTENPYAEVFLPENKVLSLPYCRCYEPEGFNHDL